jgi:hypothetical protein
LDCDDIVIGSGLSALGTVLGLPAARRVTVLAGALEGRSQYYEASRTVPCAHLGFGGLGNFWHGVIPAGAHAGVSGFAAADFQHLFHYFYAGTDLTNRLGQPSVFVPWRPVRPAREWQRLQSQRGDRLVVVPETVERFSIENGRVRVQTDRRTCHATRMWMCAGALQSPVLIERSYGAPVKRRAISDHVLCYLGQIDRAAQPEVPPPTVERVRHGMWLPVKYNTSASALVTSRPARFAFRKLDWGIERRAVFGLPMASAIAKIARSASAGLIAEALFNRAGLFPGASMLSVYAQIVVRDAHWLRADADVPLDIRHDVIRQATDAVRADPVCAGIEPSRRTDIFIPVIHLHHSVELSALEALDINRPTSSVQVMDASVYDRIGPEHHSFRLMVAAYARARALYR